MTDPAPLPHGAIDGGEARLYARWLLSHADYVERNEIVGFAVDARRYREIASFLSTHATRLARLDQEIAEAEREHAEREASSGYPDALTTAHSLRALRRARSILRGEA